MRLNALEFEANVQIVLKTPGKNNVHDLVVLTQTVFYQTSGGQDHNNGKLTLFFPKPERSRSEGSFAEILADRTAAVFDVVDLGKAGHCVTHQIVPALTEQHVHNSEFSRLDRSTKNDATSLPAITLPPISSTALPTQCIDSTYGRPQPKRQSCRPIWISPTSLL
ncbi:hypothetical protein BLNAU_2646 [Blattamonas nauphoetae]|uniref:Uncharacterized protein n=1 Tax=Blattamonas nauphoetae TaxID=2049346 RepID=A0ABQ9YDE3_9EUKA|nr:hypothetical protein BLNAU_19276 [Blattamonas nauphoetae]KAK2959685.1 hypothetical protein BLNAU_5462 [Blattamonas nauphoetae]KAK2961607.1 hypothetical protein BLNAU_3405 [Blattamonas nauphoetae]KAK2961762.1 hypothetical protein BLNAU_3199 [Blattamonas nauphoetae]KAK2962403.1 hypothetical protein BLNAU_2646 [Blattamonas nauphoetae]